MPDTLESLTKLTLAFRDARDWKQFHNAKDLAVSLCLEAAEVLELSQWRSGDNLAQHMQQPETRHRLGEELSDVLHAVLLLAHDHDIDLAEAYKTKMKANELKYPVEAAKGRAAKYTAYIQPQTGNEK